MSNVVNIFKAELTKVKNDYTYHWFSYLLSHINFFLLLAGLFYMSMSSIQESETCLVIFIFSSALWYFGFSLISSSAQSLSEDIILGTLNQLLITQSSLYKILAVRQVINLMTSLSFVAVFFFILFSFIHLPIKLSILLPYLLPTFAIFIVCSIGLFGIGIAIASLAFMFRRIGSLANLVNYIFLFFTGGLVELKYLPIWLEKLLMCIPLTLANQIFRKYLAHDSILEDFMILSVLSITYLLMGLFVFRHALKRKSVN